MLERWLASLSRTTIAILAIVLGIAFIVVSDPPVSRCDSQVDLFKDAVGSLFFITGKDKELIKKSMFVKHMDTCRFQVTPGGCYEFFRSLRILERQLREVPSTCARRIGELDKVNHAVWNGLELMVKLAWGEKPPDTYMERTGWLNTADQALFCALKKQAYRVYGRERWNAFREHNFKTLPGATKLPRKRVWSRMLLSMSCKELI